MFPKNVEDIEFDIFDEIVKRFNYTGGMNFDFKYDYITKKINIFEINPRFGGSAYTNDFIYDLLCIK
jgi:carbamoylphosphate synthase large subunit